MGAAPRHSNGGAGQGGRGAGAATSQHVLSPSSRRNASSPFNKKALAAAAVKAERKIPTTKRIRDFTRLLAKPNLDPLMRSKLEARLAAAKAEAADRAAAERERRLATKYHRVRFFERVKAERALRKAKDRLSRFLLNEEGENADGDRERRLAELESAVDAAEDELVYITHFPKGERYVSLFRGVGGENGDGGEKSGDGNVVGGGEGDEQKPDAEALARLQKERLRLRKLARARKAEEALVGEADEGRGLVRKKEKRRRGEEEEEEEEDEDDDDFLLPAASVPEKKQARAKAAAAAAAPAAAPAEAKKRAPAPRPVSSSGEEEEEEGEEEEAAAAAAAASSSSDDGDDEQEKAAEREQSRRRSRRTPPPPEGRLEPLPHTDPVVRFKPPAAKAFAAELRRQEKKQRKETEKAEAVSKKKAAAAVAPFPSSSSFSSKKKAGKLPPPPAPPKLPVRTRAEGGRKRRRKK